MNDIDRIFICAIVSSILVEIKVLYHKDVPGSRLVASIYGLAVFILLVFGWLGMQWLTHQ